MSSCAGSPTPSGSCCRRPGRRAVLSPPCARPGGWPSSTRTTSGSTWLRRGSSSRPPPAAPSARPRRQRCGMSTTAGRPVCGWPAWPCADQPAGARLPDPLRSVEDFFRAEVLECVTSRQRRLLLHSSVLDELTPDRCAEVTGIGDAGETLAALAASSLLLRRTGSGLRCHPVLRRVLGSVLSAEQPDLVPVLHARAAERLRRDGDPDAAYEHARLAGPARHRAAGGRRGLACGAPADPARTDRPAAGGRRRTRRDSRRRARRRTGLRQPRPRSGPARSRGRPPRAAAAATAQRSQTQDDRAALAVRAWLALQRGDLAAAQRDATCAVGPNRPEGASRWWLTMADAALGTAQVWDGQAADAVGTLAATAQEAAGLGYRDVAVRALDAGTAGLLLTGQPAAASLSASEAVALHEREPTGARLPSSLTPTWPRRQAPATGPLRGPQATTSTPRPRMPRRSRPSCSPVPSAPRGTLSGRGGPARRPVARSQGCPPARRSPRCSSSSGPAEFSISGRPRCPTGNAPCCVPCPGRSPCERSRPSCTFPITR